MMVDKYVSFAELASEEVYGLDYHVKVVKRSSSPVLVVAPHGGTIEIGTSEIAALIAGDEHNLFTFDGLKSRGCHRDLHITSHRFDHPDCLALASGCSIAIGVHGCRGESQIYLGGLDTALTMLVAAQLKAMGLPACTEGHRYPGRHPLNICNRSSHQRGVQLEITNDLRAPAARTLIAEAVRSAVAEHVAQRETWGTAWPEACLSC